MIAARFVLAVPRWPSPAPIARPEISRTERVCDDVPHLWVNDRKHVIDLGSAGWLVGVLFSKRSMTRYRVLPPDAPIEGGPEQLADWLVRECWGAYIAILVDRAGGDLRVLVDPSGLLPAWRCESERHVLVASDPRLFEAAAERKMEVSWDGVWSLLRQSDLRQRVTCLSGVTELVPGALADLGNCDENRAIWRPQDYLPGRDVLPFDEAARYLRRLAIDVLGAWVDCFGPLAVAASGGVDSSFICAALACGNKPFSCLTIATADPSGDERGFVAALAAHLGVRCAAAIYDPRLADPLQSASAGLPRPSRKGFMVVLDRMLAHEAQGLGTGTVLDGNGGDNLFCFLHSAAPVVDRLRVEGPGRRSLVTLLDACRLTGCDVPRMAYATLRRLFARSRADHWSEDVRLLASRPAMATSCDPLVDWLDAPVGRHAGKRDHLLLMMQAQNHLHGLGRPQVPRFSPLMSQPLLEFCLSVPTWTWCEGGINRSLARAAFASALPRDVLTRTSKAGPDSFIRQTFADHRGAIREMLLDGLLARHEVIAPPQVETALETDAFGAGSLVHRLLDLAEAEAWARSWAH